MDVREQRVSFVVTASRGEKPFSALCQEFGISRPTRYLWLSRYRDRGLDGIAEHSRRPEFSPERTPPELETRVVAHICGAAGGANVGSCQCPVAVRSRLK
jgi:transposase-like protein